MVESWWIMSGGFDDGQPLLSLSTEWYPPNQKKKYFRYGNHHYHPFREIGREREKERDRERERDRDWER